MIVYQTVVCLECLLGFATASNRQRLEASFGVLSILDFIPETNLQSLNSPRMLVMQSVSYHQCTVHSLYTT